MSKRNMMKWLIILALIVPLVLVACGGNTNTATEEPAATEEPMEEPTEAPMEEPTEAPKEEPTEAPMEEPTEAPMEEPMAESNMNGIDSCDVAADGPLAGVDPTGLSIVWWHNHSGSREEQLLPLVDQFNSTNACGITVEAQNQGSYNDIRDKVNASAAAGELPAALVVGYQNDQAFYQLNNSLADLNPYVDDATWGLSKAASAPRSGPRR